MWLGVAVATPSLTTPTHVDNARVFVNRQPSLSRYFSSQSSVCMNIVIVVKVLRLQLHIHQILHLFQDL